MKEEEKCGGREWGKRETRTEGQSDNLRMF